MRLQDVSAKSTTQLVYQKSTSTIYARSNYYVTPEVREQPYNARKSPRTGKLAVSAASFLREKSDPNYRAAMESARVALAEDYRHVMPRSLSQLRLEKGLSQTSLASAIGTSQSHVAKIEAGLLDVKFSTATRIADALAVSLDELRGVIAISKPELSKHEPLVSAS